jgi:uncharacterized protein (DUF1330 family)
VVAYAIANLHEITDPKTYEEYAALAGPNIAKYNGKLVILCKDIGVYEGSWTGNQILILEFPNRAALDAWYGSDEYAPLMEMRKKSLIADVIVIDND